jgi:iturin family lipopeptide synthetase A
MSENNQNHELTGLEIAVIGMSCRFPGTGSIDEFWNNLVNGVESIFFYTKEELLEAGIDEETVNHPDYVPAKGALEDIEYFDAAFFGYTALEAAAMNPQMRIFHECAWEAMEDAGYIPDCLDIPVGVFAGAAHSVYWEALSVLSGNSEALGIFESTLYNNKDFIGTRISYKLNLKGPGLTFFTACSTSGVSIHLACQSLLSGDSQMALAGAVSIWLPKIAGYLYQEGMIFSIDGHCRPFEAGSTGSVFGDGIGIVILKLLEDAVKDRDHIYAVIKSSAVNNDGSMKTGYTAPGTHGQAAVIKTAIYQAGIEPERINYIETHGTGTSIGDVIEIEAMKSAFNSHKRGICGIGSVKSNFGHLNTAAGMSGFIKTVLVLKHRLIPPTLHFRIPNPKIDFENSPFYVVNKLTEWKSDRYPLTAGVSSFGIGGTNFFALLEEAPQIKSEEVEPPSRPYQLILLSAKTGAALQQATENLVTFLKKNPGINIPDMAYTLQLGRKVFKHRRMLVAKEAAAASAALSSPHQSASIDQAKVYTAVTEEKKRTVVFMFPGVGAQYVNMGLELYHTEPIFREEMDRCFNILKNRMEIDIKQILYPGAKQVKFDINQAEISQPVIFIFEYALAKLLLKWGIKPDIMIGYSFGEYVTACIAGVFSLEDALKLVVSRANLIQQLPEGAMLSVPVPVEELKQLMDDNDRVSIAIDNGLAAIAAGTVQAINAFEKKMKNRKYMCIRVDNTRALHSQEMEPIMKPIEELIAPMTLREPHIPYISNVTGKRIDGNDVTHPHYWSRHLRETVRFADGIKELTKEPGAIFIEVGPGRDLSVLLGRYIENNPGQQVINLVRSPRHNISDAAYLAGKIGRLWLHGIPLDWQGFYAGQKRRRTALPTYPFERKRYWLEGDPFSKKFKPGISRQEGMIRKKTNISHWFYSPVWKQGPLIAGDHQAGAPPGEAYLVFSDAAGTADRLTARLKEQDRHVITVKIGTGFQVENQDIYAIDPGQKSNYERLIAEILKTGGMPQRVVHMWSVSRENRAEPLHNESILKAQEFGFYSLLYLVGALQDKNVDTSLQLVVITNNMQAVSGEPYLCPGQSTVLGPVMVIPQENPNIKCRSIDISLPQPGEDDWKEQRLVEQLLEELQGGYPDKIVALRHNRRWVQTYEPIKLEPPVKEAVQLREQGVYLVTGGLGGIGLVLAEYMAEKAKAKLVLIGRSPFPPRNEWDHHLISDPGTGKINQRIRKIRKIEESGGKVLVISGDVADENRMYHAIKEAEQVFGPINGIIHAAGIVSEEFFSAVGTLTKKQCETHFQAKIWGLLNLLRICRHKKLDFIFLMSSISSQLGGLGFAAYSAANIFMDSMLQMHNRENPVPCIAVNWDEWKLEESKRPLDKLGASQVEFSMNREEGLEAFTRILGHVKEGRVVHSLGDLQARIDQWINIDSHEKTGDSRKKTSLTLSTREDLSTPYTAPRNQLEQTLADIWQDFFGIREVGIDDDFFELGGDSLKGITLAARLHRESKVRIPIQELFKYPTIKGLAQYIQGSVQEEYILIEPVERKEYYPMSSVQKRLYFLHQMHEDGLAYNIPSAWILEGDTCKDRLEESLKRLILRHESFRTSFEMIDEEPVQRIHENAEFEIEYYDVSRVKDGEKGIVEDFARVFDLSKAPLLHVKLVKLQKHRHVLLIDFHHMISDGVTVDVLLEDLEALYLEETLPAIKLHYKDYAGWQARGKNSQIMEKQAQYWKKEFEGEIPVLELPTDYPRPAIKRFEGTRQTFTLGTDITAALKDLVQETGTTLYIVLLAIYTVFLYKITGQEDIMVGSSAAGRRHADLERIFGMLLNTLVLRNYPSGKKRFIDFLAEVKEKALAAFENQEYLYEDLVEQLPINRDTSRNPLFDVMFEVQNTGDPTPRFPGLEVIPYQFPIQTAQFDLMLTAVEAGKTIRFTLEYSTKLFKPQTIKRFIAYFMNVVSGILENTHREIPGIEIITAEEKRQVLYDFNNTQVDYPRDKTVHELFEEQVEKTPDHISIVGEPAEENSLHIVQLSYRELDEKSAWLAGELAARGVGPDAVAAVMLVRSLEMIAALTAIFKSGGAYLPIDPGFPPERIGYQLADSSVHLLITTGNWVKEIEMIRGWTGEIICLDMNFSPAAAARTTSPASPADLAYVIYTSGSTGKSKGVMVEHSGMMNHIQAKINDLQLTDQTIIAQNASHTFDISVWQFFTALIKGGKTVIYPDEKILNPNEFIYRIIKDRVTILEVVPSYLVKILETLDQSSLQFRTLPLEYLLVTGEEIKPELVEKWYTSYSGIPMVNAYGPTEASDDITHYIIDKWGETKGSRCTRVPIGKPLQNLNIYIVDKGMKLCPIRVTGEIWVSGIGVCRGYLNNPELTAERFRRNVISHSSFVISSFLKTKDQCPMTNVRSAHYPITPIPHHPIYLTGDLARWLPDGNIEFLGRIDHQVKIRGFRIELGDIENQLLKYREIKDAVAATVELAGEKYLCAYIVSNKELILTDLRTYLSDKLPGYMIPSYFVRLDAIPLTSTGKADRKKLPPPEMKPGEEPGLPRSQLEKKLTNIWASVLGINKEIIGADVNFFQLGGHSLKATSLISRLHKEFNVKIQVAEVFKHPTVRDLSKVLQESPVVIFSLIRESEKKEYYELSPIQEQFYFIRQTSPGSTAYNMPGAFIIEGSPDENKLEKVFAALVSRHEVLRTSFAIVDEHPVQKISPIVSFRLEYNEEKEQTIDGLLQRFLRPFNLEQAPLFRAKLAKLAGGKYLLMVDMHHIISDAVSVDIFIRDFISLYSGKQLFPLRIQYKDYSQWIYRGENAELVNKQERYWLQQFHGNIPVLELPADYPRQSVKTFSGDVIKFRFSPGLDRLLMELALKEGVSMFMLILALFNVLFSKLSSQEEIIVGTLMAGRRHQDLEQIIGLFVNTIALKNYPRGHMTFKEFLHQVKESTMQAYENQDYPLVLLANKLHLDKSKNRNPLFDVLFFWDNLVGQSTWKMAKEIPGLHMKPYEYQPDISKLDMTLTGFEIEGSLSFTFEYSTQLFKKETIERFISYFRDIVKQICENKNTRLSDIHLSHGLLAASSVAVEENQEGFRF